MLATETVVGPRDGYYPPVESEVVHLESFPFTGRGPGPARICLDQPVTGGGHQKRARSSPAATIPALVLHRPLPSLT
jgi:hypothetical protein